MHQLCCSFWFGVVKRQFILQEIGYVVCYPSSYQIKPRIGACIDCTLHGRDGGPVVLLCPLIP